MPSTNISPLNIKLDTSNPRFLNAQVDEIEAINYLLKYSKVVDLARSIVIEGGLYPGERIVVFRNEDNTYTVLEGNRRTCACKLLLDRNLIPEGFRSIFPLNTESVVSNLSQIEVDIVNGIDEAERFIASRHIDSVLLWSPLAKMKFFADRFDSGQTIQSIADSTRTQIGKVRDGIKKYKLLMYGVNFSCWTLEQKEKLDLINLEIDKFIRIFGTRGATTNFGLSYNQLFEPGSSLGPQALEQIVKRIMYCAFITENDDERIDTRTPNWVDVPGLRDIINRLSGNTEQNNNTASADNGSNNTGQKDGTSGTGAGQAGGTSSAGQANGQAVGTSQAAGTGQAAGQTSGSSQTGTAGQAGSTNPRPASPTHSRSSLIPTTCILNIPYPKIHNIYADLQKLNVDNFTNSVAITFRVFFELTIEEYLNSQRIPVTPSMTNLASKYNALVAHLVQNRQISSRDATALRQITSNNQQAPSILSITNFHDYVHRINYQPIPRDLKTIWDNIQHLMQIIYP